MGTGIIILKSINKKRSVYDNDSLPAARSEEIMGEQEQDPFPAAALNQWSFYSQSLRGAAGSERRWRRNRENATRWERYTSP